MLMVFVMNVPVFMLQRRVRMFVLVAFRQMYPEANRHKGTCRDELDRQRLMEQHQRKHCAKVEQARHHPRVDVPQ
ncbi:MAG: hypothetical protein POH28_11320 [Acidocella sp.]|nr:hypothetical protein [Acidocella sp.]MDE8346745.1 hypothetical protein [Acidocella sp.]